MKHSVFMYAGFVQTSLDMCVCSFLVRK